MGAGIAMMVDAVMATHPPHARKERDAGRVEVLAGSLQHVTLLVGRGFLGLQVVAIIQVGNPWHCSTADGGGVAMHCIRWTDTR